MLPLGLDASAQPRPTESPVRPGDQPRSTPPMERDREPRTGWQAPEGVFEANKIVGTRVRSTDGRDLGEIDHLLVNTSDGEVSHVVIGRGGVAGIGETKIVVPWSQVRVSRDRDGLVATVDASALAQAPRYEGKNQGRDRERPPAASPGTTPRMDRDRTQPGMPTQPR